MLDSMLVMSSGGGGIPIVHGAYGFKPYSSRVKYKSGGFYVENGICYVDIVYTTATSVSAGQTALGNGSTCAVASSQGTTKTTLGDITVRYNSAVDEQFHFLTGHSSGEDIHFVGNFKTSAPDTIFTE